VRPTKKIAILGSKKSGKTSIAELLISNLTSRGLRIGALKHIHHHDFTMDRRDTDTWRHRAAGASFTAYISPSEAGLIVKLCEEPKDLEEVMGMLKLSNVDVLIIEGLHRLVAKRSDVGKILAFKTVNDLEERLKGTEHPILAACTFNSELKDLTRNDVNCLFLPRDVQKLLDIVEKYLKLQWPQQ